MKYDVFISYRHETSWDDAYQLQKALAERGYNVFMDDHSIPDGNFKEKIYGAIDESPVVILMLARGALDKCCSEDDWIRKEIGYAIGRGCYILPVLPTDQTPWTSPTSLPKNIRNALEEQGAKLYKGDEQLFEKSVDIIEERILGSTQYLLARAHQAYKEQNFLQAAEDFEECAGRGNAEAKCWLGLMLCAGQGVGPDRRKAYKLFKEAAKLGYPRAWFNLGRMHEQVGGWANAIKCYKGAAKLGDKGAEDALARLAKTKKEDSSPNRIPKFVKFIIILLAIPGLLACIAIFMILLKIGIISF